MESTSEVEKHIPRFFQHSCLGNRAEEVNSEATLRQQGVAVEKSAMEENGWITSLVSMPNFSNQNLVERLIGSSVYWYKLWKEDYTRCVVKAMVCASMKNIQFDIYVHLD